MDSAPYTYSGQNTCTVMANGSYLSNTGHIPTNPHLGGATMGLMMLLSSFQYQAPYMNPVYSNAASQAGKAAFMESGGQDTQDKFMKMVTSDGTKTLKDAGITDTEMGAAGLAVRTLRSRQLNLNGPKIYSVKSSLTADQNGASLGLRWDFK
jgi:hypothetical protein